MIGKKTIVHANKNSNLSVDLKRLLVLELISSYYVPSYKTHLYIHMGCIENSALFKSLGKCQKFVRNVHFWITSPLLIRM